MNAIIAIAAPRMIPAAVFVGRAFANTAISMIVGTVATKAVTKAADVLLRSHEANLRPVEAKPVTDDEVDAMCARLDAQMATWRTERPTAPKAPTFGKSSFCLRSGTWRDADGNTVIHMANESTPFLTEAQFALVKAHAAA